MQKAEMFLGPVGPVGHGQGQGPGASTAKPLLSACAGAAGAAGAGGGGASEEAVRPKSDTVATHETPEATRGLSRGLSWGLSQRVRGWKARGGSWVRGIAAAAIQLGRDGGRSQQGWLEIEMKKTPRPDQLKPLQLKVSC